MPAPSSTGASAVDLSVLKGLSFGPDWSGTPSAATLARKMGGRGEGKPGRGRDFGGFDNGAGQRRDRRPSRPATPAAFAPAPQLSTAGGENAGPAQAGEASRAPFRGNGGPRQFRGEGFGRGDRRHSPAPFRPTHEVLFYPDDAAFRALLKAIRSTCRTYELFEVARLILQKPERFVFIIKPLTRPDGTPGRLFLSQPDQLPFETEDDAISHVFDKHLDKFCDVETVDVEPPKGNFVGVSRCGMTGELLGPPNYHRYQQLLREHHARRLSRVPFDKFVARIELAKEPEHLAAWLEKMKKSTRYKLKTPIEGAPEFFESLDAARQFLVGKNKDAIVRDTDSVRHAGRNMEQLPQGNIRRSVEACLELQRRFPLDTANNLRGRLRRMKFNLYKKGSKGVSYICAVKRRFRDPQTVLAGHVQKLITFIEQHPMTPASRLPHEFLGLPLPEKKVEQAAATSVEKEAAQAANPVPSEQQAAGAEATNTTESEKSTAPSFPTPAYTPEQQQQLRELVINLRWLVMEGYVIEFGDGKLFAPPALPAPKAKAANEGAVPEEAESPTLPSGEEDIIEEGTASPFAAEHEDENAGSENGVESADFVDPLEVPASDESPAAEPPVEGQTSGDAS